MSVDSFGGSKGSMHQHEAGGDAIPPVISCDSPPPQEAQSAASKRRLRAVVDMAVVGLQKARDRQARFTADPQRFIEERRAELTKEIAELHDELATLRRSVGLPPLPFPLEREEQKEPLSPPAPFRSISSTMASSLHKRRTQSYTD